MASRDVLSLLNLLIFNHLFFCFDAGDVFGKWAVLVRAGLDKGI